MMADSMMFNKKQHKVLKRLSKVFKEAEKVGIEFVGCDTSLIAFRKDVYEIVMDNKDSAYPHGVGDISNHEESITVDTHGTYRDSGGA